MKPEKEIYKFDDLSDKEQRLYRKISEAIDQDSLINADENLTEVLNKLLEEATQDKESEKISIQKVVNAQGNHSGYQGSHSGMTLLAWAILKSINLPAVKWLLDKCDKVAVIDFFKNTPYHCLSTEDGYSTLDEADLQTLIGLLSEHCFECLTALNRFDKTPLFVAADKKDVKAVKFILTELNKFYQGQDDYTPLCQIVHCWGAVVNEYEEKGDKSEESQQALKHQVKSYSDALSFLFDNRAKLDDDKKKAFDEDANKALALEKNKDKIFKFFEAELRKVLDSQTDVNNPLLNDSAASLTSTKVDITPKSVDTKSAPGLLKWTGYILLFPIVGLITALVMLGSWLKKILTSAGSTELTSSTDRAILSEDIIPETENKKTFWCQYTAGVDGLFSKFSSEEKSQTADTKKSQP